MATAAVIRTELVKNLRRTRTYVAFGILVLIPVIMATAIQLNPPDARGEGRLLFLASQTGLILPAFALRITSAFLLVIVPTIRVPANSDRRWVPGTRIPPPDSVD